MEIYLIPKIVYNEKVFINHVLLHCKLYDIPKEKIRVWLHILKRDVNRGAYFWGMILIRPKIKGILRFLVLTHEVIHHINQIVKIIFCSNIRILDNVNDLTWIIVERKMGRFKQLLKLYCRTSR